MEEKWKKVEGYNKYYISNLGRCKNGKTDRILKPSLSRKGYKQIVLSKNSICKSFHIHRLVAIHFINNPENKPQVNHKDGNKQNNKVENLEWCTGRENIDHYVGRETDTKKVSSKYNYFSDEEIRKIRKRYRDTKDSCRIIAEDYGVYLKTIYNIVKRKTYKDIS